jgi:hypothetical protein
MTAMLRRNRMGQREKFATQVDSEDLVTTFAAAEGVRDLGLLDAALFRPEAWLRANTSPMGRT